MSYLSDYTTSQDTSFRQKVFMAAKQAALAIAGETASGHPQLDSKRVDLSNKVTNDMLSTSSGGMIDRFCFSAVTGGVLTTSSTDTDIYNRITAIWNDLAGVTTADESGT